MTTMEFDMQNVSMPGGVIVFPDWPFANLPRTDVRQDIVLRAGVSTSQQIGGTADREE